MPKAPTCCIPILFISSLKIKDKPGSLSAILTDTTHMFRANLTVKARDYELHYVTNKGAIKLRAIASTCRWTIVMPNKVGY